jgi:magnesium-protoporphyrin O-methyltransferase
MIVSSSATSTRIGEVWHGRHGVDSAAMKSCCPPPGAEIFTERLARRDAARYRRKGLAPVGRRLVELVRGRGRDVLEIGGGVGALQLELLRDGVDRAVNVELSPAYEKEAGALAREAGVETRVDRHLLDFARGAGEIEAADIVLMHRVVCCYPDMPALVAAAADHSRRMLALSYPPDTWVFRTAARGINLWSRLMKQEFRFFVHQPPTILRVAAEHGLELATRERCRFWEVAALERA